MRATATCFGHANADCRCQGPKRRVVVLGANGITPSGHKACENSTSGRCHFHHVDPIGHSLRHVAPTSYLTTLYASQPHRTSTIYGLEVTVNGHLVPQGWASAGAACLRLQSSGLCYTIPGFRSKGNEWLLGALRPPPQARPVRSSLLSFSLRTD